MFLKAGATAFGDTGPLLAFIERDLVESRGVLTKDNVTEALTYTQLLPGSTVVQIVSYLGYKLGGWPGSAASTFAYVLPATLMMMAMAAGYVASTALPVVTPAVHGLTAAAVGMLLATAWRLAQRNLSKVRPLTYALTATAFFAGVVLHFNAAVIVVAAGLIGALLFLDNPARAENSR